MSSRRYRTYKFFYDDDRGLTTIKQHRSYLSSDGLTEDTPTTQLFLDRVIDIPEKVTGTSVGLRHVLAYVGQRELTTKIPYRPGDPKLIEHIEEILAVGRVECGDYFGERNITGGSSTSISG